MRSFAAQQMTRSPAPIAGELVRSQLERLRRSPAFARSANLFAFLRFVVEETIAGHGDTLKELVVGDTLYGRRTPYDPRIESTVRVEARRLRRKLGEHYNGPGRDDPIRIELPVGSYRPCISAMEAEVVDAADAEAAAMQGHEVDLAIMPFRALSSEVDDARFADGLTDELIHVLADCTQLRLAPRLSVFQFKDRLYTTADAARWLGAPLLLHGTLRREGGRYRIMVEVVTPEGRLVWSGRFDARGADRLQSQEDLAREIATRLPTSTLTYAPIRDAGVLAAPIAPQLMAS